MNQEFSSLGDVARLLAIKPHREWDRQQAEPSNALLQYVAELLSRED